MVNGSAGSTSAAMSVPNARTRSKITLNPSKIVSSSYVSPFFLFVYILKINLSQDSLRTSFRNSSFQTYSPSSLSKRERIGSYPLMLGYFGSLSAFWSLVPLQPWLWRSQVEGWGNGPRLRLVYILHCSSRCCRFLMLLSVCSGPCLGWRRCWCLSNWRACWQRCIGYLWLGVSLNLGTLLLLNTPPP